MIVGGFVVFVIVVGKITIFIVMINIGIITDVLLLLGALLLGLHKYVLVDFKQI